jgi:voltage-gated potassium channel
VSAPRPPTGKHGNAYEIFILVLTLFALLLMVLQLLPLDEDTRFLVRTYDNIACVIFLIDFVFNLVRSHPRRAYFIDQRGWLDLLGSVPALGFFQYTALLRLARISRLTRTLRVFRGEDGRGLVRDVIRNRGSYASFITIMAVLLVLSLSSIAVLQFESKAPNANIRTGGDALWWSVVTITTVGYGDYFPVTALGRMTAFVVMIAGVGIIGALASILASFLVTSPSDAEADAQAVAGEAQGTSAEAPPPAPPAADVATELVRLSAEVKALREQLEARGT